MSSKKKGSRTERELFHMFWDTKKFAVVRIAGSGSTSLPAPDLLVGGNNKIFAIECKSVKGDKKYIKKEQIKELNEFSEKFGAVPLIGIKFNNRGWYFINPNKLKSKGKMIVVSLENLKSEGITFEKLIF